MMFASKTPRDLNRDPAPWTYDIRGNGFRSHIPFTHPGDLRVTDWIFDPRPEYDHHQHNEPNPILVEARNVPRGDRLEDWFDQVNNKAWLKAGQPDVENPFTLWWEFEIHAWRVLTRLANLTEGETK